MSWKKERSPFHTTTFRLTLWYAGLFGTLSLMAFLWVYLDLAAGLNRQVDRQLSDDASEFEELYRQGGLKPLQHEFDREAGTEGIGRVFMRLTSPNQKILAASNLHAWGGLGPVLPTDGVSVRRPVSYATLSLPDHSHKIRTILKPLGDGNFLQIGTTLKTNETLMESYRETFGTALVVMLLTGAVAGWLLARRAMSGVARVTQTAVRIGEGDLSRRVPLGQEGQEIDDLARAFNTMLERIQTLIGELKEVTDNIAHDLRSPLTRIRGIAETTFTGRTNLEGYREMASTVIEESDRLVEMINTMLEIAQTDAGLAELSEGPVDIRRIMQEAAELFQPMAEDKGVRLVSDAGEHPLTIQGDRVRLQRVIANLLDNAIKYTPAGGRASLSAEETRSRVIVRVSDTGIGIREADLSRIFDRFYRSDPSRSTPGNGLGLSLAQAVIRAHRGEIKVTSSPGQGSTFTLILPKTVPAHAPS
jgi:heavy metal sensor kinase